MFRSNRQEGLRLSVRAHSRARLAGALAVLVVVAAMGACLPGSRRAAPAVETVAPPKANPETGQDFLDEGNFYLDRPGMGMRAMASYQKALKRDPVPRVAAQAWCGIGRVHLINQEYDKANKCFLKATQTDPENPLAWTCLATLYFQQATATSELEFKLMRQSIGCATKAIAVDPMYANAYVARGRARQILGQKRDAAREYLAALDLGLSDYAAAIVRDYLANAWFDAGEYELAIEQLRVLLALPDTDPRARASWQRMIPIAEEAMGQRPNE